MKGAIGASYQKESSSFLFIENPPESPFARHVSAEFAELQIPLVGSANALPLVSQLGLSLAVRHDDYSDFGTTTNPRYGVSWKPRDDLHIRGAYSTSFRAPNAYEQTRSLTGLLVVTQLLESPTGGTVPTFVVAGQTGVLKPEKARNVNFGFDYEPLFLKDLTVSFDYYDILYRDRIITPTPNANSLLTPDVYGPLITPLQDDAAAQAYLNSYLAQGATFLDNLGTGFTGVRYAFSSLEQNAAQVRQRGLDLALRYAFAVGPNRFHISLNGAYIDEIETAFTSSSTPTNTVNTYGNPLRVRAREEFSWNRGRFEVAAAVNYNGNYINTAVPGNPPIASWTDADLRFRYQPSFSNGLSLGLSVSNVFNRDPPYVSDQGGGTPGIHYDVGNGNPVGRLVVIDARKAW
jgi:iron complex outermembrane receptor protein